VVGKLFLPFISERTYFDGYPEIYQHWRETMIEALEAGWNIKQLCKLNKNVARSLQLVTQIMDWTNYQGNYELYYFDKYGITNPPYEIIMVKGKGAIQAFAAEQHDEVGAALFTDDKGSVDVIARFVEQMFIHVEPLVKILTLNDYFELNAAKDRRAGNHLTCFHELSFLTVPYEIMEKYLQISIPEASERAVHLRRVRDCNQSFIRDIQTYKMRHIYPMRVIEHLVKKGQYIKNWYFRPTSKDIAGHLKHIIWLLKTYDHFEIALVSENQFALLNQTEWDIKGDHTMVMGVLPKNDKDSNVELLAITEGTILSAFQEYFDDLWERINPLHKDKEFVIAWMEGMLKKL
jgi:hypothetical protein